VASGDDGISAGKCVSILYVMVVCRFQKEEVHMSLIRSWCGICGDWDGNA
jgi:hypothetical protein